MKWKNTLTIVLLTTLGAASSAYAESKRVEVYSLSQNYWDTQPGETLGEIVKQLLPNNPSMQHKLMTDIVSQNPNAFPDGNADFMRANSRLWLPNNLIQTDSKADSRYTEVESFSWGNIKRPKR